MIKRFVIGDIHGRIEALLEVLKKANFNYEKDKLIVLGDVVDGGFNTYEVIEELLKIKNLILVKGNHDRWFVEYLKTDYGQPIWLNQGGKNTIASYGNAGKSRVPVKHRKFLDRAPLYYIEDNMLFVHGGIDPYEEDITKQEEDTLLWDRLIITHARLEGKIQKWDKVFIGHTTTETITGEMKPVIYNNLYCMDCGAGWSGKLCIMNIDTEEYWLSKKQEPALRDYKWFGK